MVGPGSPSPVHEGDAGGGARGTTWSGPSPLPYARLLQATEKDVRQHLGRELHLAEARQVASRGRQPPATVRAVPTEARAASRNSVDALMVSGGRRADLALGDGS